MARSHRSGLAWSLLLAAAATLGATAAAQAAGSVIVLTGKGAQIYACSSTAGRFGWVLKGPDADLLDSQGKLAGRHFAGPTWQAQDGSAVAGRPVASGASPVAGAVAWLVLAAKSHTGSGMFANVAYVVRAGTKGGAAPAGGCDQAHLGAQARVPYSATYMFFPAAK